VRTTTSWLYDKSDLGKEEPYRFFLASFSGARFVPCSLIALMTRSRKSASLTRRLFVRTTEEDQVRIRANALKAGLDVSEYVRRVAVDGHVIVRRESAYGMSLAHQLRRIGVNINQLTRVANTEGELPDELARVCGQLETILDRVIRME